MSSTRLERWLRTHNAPRKPLTECRRGDLILSGGAYVPVPRDVSDAVRAVYHEYEILFDLVTTDGRGPGYHLYRRKGPGGCPSDDLLRLEAPLQYDMEQLWPLGRPRYPGMWFLPLLKAAEKARQPGDEAAIEARNLRESRESIMGDFAKHDREYDDSMGMVLRELAIPIHRGYMNPNPFRKRQPAGRKTTHIMP
jgi:hypothetical protein